MTLALCCLALALLCRPPPVRRLDRLAASPNASVIERVSVEVPDDPFSVAAGLDLFAVCLRAGLPVASAAAAAAEALPPRLAESLSRAAELLALGADPVRAWQPPAGCDDDVEALFVLARRSARAGSSMAAGVTELAERLREAEGRRAVAAAERAGVKISGPLGLCFLPAFICLGIIPVVIGLAGGALGGL